MEGRISDQGCIYLAKVKTLKWVDLRNTVVGRVGIERLLKNKKDVMSEHHCLIK